ncbi:hypothetical protein HP567_011490 [Brevibacillus sp. M2.1A]|uniref:hypothetical protein n=1 Tax=Brevibacillus TaxID=55080 RepID=UPI00156B7945|nr:MULTISPECIES: hypothetical protein [Brevibacillus]MCC8435167.1 hypothetical protein [Brevibacillus sp. M2.1A]MCM3141936.1 hypothetical protein [Brevibacillus sp. MER 51]UKK97549.1 hypothetical protein FO446_09020 [Brevibacillus brevis]
MKRALSCLSATLLLASMLATPSYAESNKTTATSPSSKSNQSIQAKAIDPHLLNGFRVKETNSATVYLVMDGKKRGIVSAEVYFKLFNSWDGIREYSSLSSIPDGQVIGENAQLIKFQNSATVYLLDEENGRVVKRGITSASVFNKYNFDWSKIIVLADSLKNAFPDGSLLDK